MLKIISQAKLRKEPLVATDSGLAPQSGTDPTSTKRRKRYGLPVVLIWMLIAAVASAAGSGWVVYKHEAQKGNTLPVAAPASASPSPDPSTSPNVVTDTAVTLTPKQLTMLLTVGLPTVKGFNDGTLGSLLANKYDPVAQVTYLGQRYVALTWSCFNHARGKDDTTVNPVVYASCVTNANKGTTGPIVYLGLIQPITDATGIILFDPSRVMVDVLRGPKQVQRCTLVVADATTGAGSYNLPTTVTTLETSAGSKYQKYASPDSGASYWTCAEHNKLTITTQ